MVKNNKKKERKKHSALNPSLRKKKHLFQAGTQRYHFSSPSLLLFYPGKGYTDKRYSHLKIVCYQQPSFAFEINLGIPLQILEAYG